MLRELDKSFHRPETRRLVDLTNSELTLLFQRRAKELAEALDGHIFWDNECIVYWNTFIKLQDYLYEVMMEIQSRYPAKEVWDDFVHGDTVIETVRAAAFEVSVE
jgi:hypothetical protein